MILPSGLTIGQELQQALQLDDVILDIEITANRGDCLSVVGIAREVAALSASTLHLPEIVMGQTGNQQGAPLPLRIESPELCPFYALRLIQGVRVAPSPFWLKRSIIASGGKPVNNIVDVTNFVMWELGQPLHAFDSTRLDGPEIVVRRARAGEVLTTLDGKKRVLGPQMLVIADRKEAVALAGVMGGKQSEVVDTSTDILLEAALFDAVNTGRTSRKLGLVSEASARFDRGIDPAMLRFALDRASALIQETSGGLILDPPCEAGELPLKKTTLSFRPARVHKLAGSQIAPEICRDALTRLGFEVQDSSDQDQSWVVTVPTFRRDVSREIDLIEEVCRLYGYDNIGASLPALGRTGGSDKRAELFASRLRGCLVGCGFYEAKTHSLVSKEMAAVGLEETRQALAVRNPLSSQQGYLRPHLFPQLVDAAGNNFRLGMPVVRLVEIGEVFA